MATRKTNSSKAVKTTRPSTKTSEKPTPKVARAKTTSRTPRKNVTPATPPPTKTESKPIEKTERAERRPFRIKRLYIILGILAIALIGLLVYYRRLFVVATVNGQPITRLAYINETEQVYIPEARTTAGKQAMNQLVTKALLMQEAKKRNITVSQKEVDDEVAATRKNLEKSGQKLESALQLQGDSLDAYKERIKIQKILDKLVGKITVSDKEIQDYIAKNQESLSAQGLTGNDLNSQVKQSLEQQKYNEKVQSLIQSLQQKAKVTYLINS